MIACRSLFLRNGTNHRRIHNAAVLRLDDHKLCGAAGQLSSEEKTTFHFEEPFSRSSVGTLHTPKLGPLSAPPQNILQSVLRENLKAASLETLLINELSGIQAQVNNEIGVLLSESLPGEALASFREANSPRSLFNMSILLRELGKEDEALDCLNQAANLGHPGALFNLAVHFNQNGQSLRAKKLMVQAAEAGNPQARKIVTPKVRTTQG
eukprot:TRINITY_DN7769_c0_g1_i1.p1 TRINITY_DN7769_c0_g1~~TRINITY_DN7769_c0_g1_i1.p1  ORF type:complete len:218 (+),score=54.13 TRINITY_DN7769_c0_g1_i1:26-655(+)